MNNSYEKQMWLKIVGVVDKISEDGIAMINNEGIVINIRFFKSEIGKYKIGDEIKISLNIKIFDENIKLVGFIDDETKVLFVLLTNVQGIGNNSAFNIIDNLMLQGRTINDICYEIMIGNVGMIASVPGIGPNAAQRIIDTLKDKVKIESANVKYDSPNVLEAIEMLKSLGFTTSKIDKALEELTDCNNMLAMDVVQAVIKKINML